jgi:hypothetical protein
MTTKERLHRFVDELSEQEADDALRVLTGRRQDPVVRMLEDAPEDDEPFTDEDRAALDEAYAELDGGAPTMPVDEFRRRYA